MTKLLTAFSLQKTFLESELTAKTEESLSASNSTGRKAKSEKKASELDASQRMVKEAGTQLVKVRNTLCVLKD
jgi:hypothetical protein